MKISQHGISNLPTPPERESVYKSESNADTFAVSMTKTYMNKHNDRLAELMAAINAQGKNLALTPTFGELKGYRELVRQFMETAVERMYSLQSQSGWDRQGRQKMFTTIKQVDDKLAELTEDVRVGQERQLNIMERLDSIRGMLIDLYT